MFAALMALLERVTSRSPTALRTYLVGQFHRPTGPLGHVVGWIMATRRSNVDRNRWAVEQLDVRPTDRVLEVGFGPGVAVEALAARVTEGVVYGVDHSEVMAKTARRRNTRAIAAGRVVLTAAGVDEVDDGLRPLDLVLAVNNIGMWPDPPAQLRRLRSMLAPGGRIAIGNQPRIPGADAETARRGAEETAALLTDAGFDVVETRRLDLDPPFSLVVGARPGPDHS
jgi:trans-aconitate methyltransferase